MNNATVKPSASEEVLARLLSGDELVLDASLSYQSCFSKNGERVPHQVMQSLLDREAVNPPPEKRGQAWSPRR